MKTMVTLLLLLTASSAFAYTAALTYDPAVNIVSRAAGAGTLYTCDALNRLAVRILVKTATHNAHKPATCNVSNPPSIMFAIPPLKMV